MWAFIIAGIVFVGTVLVWLFMGFAAAMSDSPSASREAGAEAFTVLIGGSVLALLIAGSHWLPHFGW